MVFLPFSECSDMLGTSLTVFINWLFDLDIPSRSYSLFSYVFGFYLGTVSLSAYMELDSIMYVINTFRESDMQDWAYFLGTSWGLFYYYGIRPLINLITLPFFYMIGNSSISSLLMENLWIHSWVDFGTSIWTSILSDIEFFKAAWIDGEMRFLSGNPDRDPFSPSNEGNHFPAPWEQDSEEAGPSHIETEYNDPWSNDENKQDTDSDKTETGQSHYKEYFKSPDGSPIDKGKGKEEFITPSEPITYPSGEHPVRWWVETTGLFLLRHPWLFSSITMYGVSTFIIKPVIRLITG